MLRVSLIISTYNRPDALALCLESVKRQKRLPDEVIIGDDGSRKETKLLIESFQKDFPVPLLHIWQEDKGFRVAKIRNKCIARARCEYIVQVDGDMVLHPSFIADHLSCAKEGYYIKGGRVNITKAETVRLCKNKKYIPLGFFTWGLTRRENAIHCLWLAKYLAPRRKSRPGLGCNTSYWKADVLRMNGYDEYYVGWGGEDYDFSVRLLNIGCKKLALKFAAIGFHLWHEDKFMQNREKNFNYYFEKIAEKATWCKCGVDQYLGEDTLEES